MKALESIQQLPSIPNVVSEVVRLAPKKDAGVEDLANAISLDPAMSARLLQVANSAILGRSHKIATLQRACSQIGFHATRYWVLSFAVVNVLGNPKVEGFDYHRFWKSSVIRAVAAKLTAAATAPKLADESFAAGLLSQVGQLALVSSRPEDYKADWDAGGSE